MAETPPLTRGRPTATTKNARRTGNTPAYAGKTRRGARESGQMRETPPLTRGRPSVAPMMRAAPKETPPLTRGRHEWRQTLPPGFGNTPAYAGKTRSPFSTKCLSKKHPRLRGEDSHLSPERAFAPETPPLTRGRHQVAVQEAVGNGNTPAYAGKTHRRDPTDREMRKHPRLRGEDREPCHKQKKHAETPPLTRGRLKPMPAVHWKERNTPAYAGKTFLRRL